MAGQANDTVQGWQMPDGLPYWAAWHPAAGQGREHSYILRHQARNVPDQKDEKLLISIHSAINVVMLDLTLFSSTLHGLV
jgi:hypothetical protein